MTNTHTQGKTDTFLCYFVKEKEGLVTYVIM